MRFENPYEVLGVSAEASEDEIRAAYEKLLENEDRKADAQAAYEQILEQAEKEKQPEEPAEKPEEEPEEQEKPAEEEKPQEPEENRKSNQKSGATPGQITIGVIIIVLLAGILAALIWTAVSKEAPDAEQPETAQQVASGESGAAEAPEVPEVTVPATIPEDGNPADETCKGTYTGSDEQVIANAEMIVAAAGDHHLTNAELQIYYWMGIQSYVQNSGPYIQFLNLDLSRPLETQPCPLAEGRTWQQFFLQQALKSWQNYQSMAAEAEAAGHEMSEELQQALKDLPQQMEDQAKDLGFADAKALLANNVGPGASIEDYVKFMETYNRGYGYFAETVEASKPDDAAIEAYYGEHEEELLEGGISKDTKVVSARHILISPEDTESEESWTKAEEEARKLLDEFLAGDKTEESFGKLATEHTMDPGSQQTGGLYEDIAQGQMVPEFDQWCFDGSRKAGDTGIVKTTYGYHIMYYVSSRPVWQEQVSQIIMNEIANKLVEDSAAKYPLDIDYASILLGELKEQ